MRVGNAADGQVQLDVFGSIISLIDHLSAAGVPLSDRHWRLLEQMALAVSRRWSEPDHGIWQQRIAPRHNTYSKTMCWFALDRAIALSQAHRGYEPAAWVTLRDEIASLVLTEAWSKQRGAFTATLGGLELGASVLAIGLTGLIAPNDPRFVSTVSTIERELLDGKTVRRYLTDDGLPGRPGGFHVATGWLIETLALIGRADDARDLFTSLCGFAGTTRLLTEQVDPDTGLGRGNFPSASAHAAVIRAALATATRSGR
ncbi:MAG: glycoside hydrolase family 15 protein [Acidimicrobiales bacterium]